MQHSYQCSHFIKELGLWDEYLKKKEEFNEWRRTRPKTTNAERVKRYYLKKIAFRKKGIE